MIPTAAIPPVCPVAALNAGLAAMRAIDPAEALRAALDAARLIVSADLDTTSPKFDAVQGCLSTILRLELTVLQAHLLLTFARQPAAAGADLARDLHLPENVINDAVSLLFKRGLIAIADGGAHQLTASGLNIATVIVAITALAEAGNARRRMDAQRAGKSGTAN